MNKLILMAGAAALLGATPALAEKGKGNSGAKANVAAKVSGGGKAKASAKANVNARGMIDTNRNGIADWRERRLIDANGNGIPDFRERRTVDINNNGIADWRERLIDRNRDGIDDRQQAMGNRYGGDVCPPGLARKSPACIPPGQVGRSGTMVPTGWDFIDYGNIPLSVRNQYNLDDDYRYVYRDGRLYVVNPTTNLITRIINAIRF
jgi:hypothetical protein